MIICSWNEKMCFWLVFPFSQDSKFILSVRRSKRNEELSEILFLRCVLRDSKHLFVFLPRRDGSQFFQIYMVLEMEGSVESIRGFFKGNFICILGGTVFPGERLSCLKDVWHSGTLMVNASNIPQLLL